MSKLSKESNALYLACMQDAKESAEGLRKRFSQQDLEELVQCTLAELMRQVNELVAHSLFRSVRQQQQISWILRTRETAANMANLSEAERMVFTIIEDADTNGAWIKKIKTVTNVPPNEVQRAVAKMEKLGFVKGIRNVKAPAQRMYILSHLVPSHDVTGGSFFDAGELDQSLVEELCHLIIYKVRQESWIESKRRVKQEAIQIDDDGHKRPRESIEDDHGANKRRKHENEGLPQRSEITESLQLAYPAGTKAYPTAADIHHFIKHSNAMRESKTDSLKVEEIQGLMDMLVWDDKLEQIRGGYRTARGVNYTPLDDDDDSITLGNGLTDVPCGRCQVTNLCQEGTKVSAATCEYFQDWLTP